MLVAKAVSLLVVAAAASQPVVANVVALALVLKGAFLVLVLKGIQRGIPVPALALVAVGVVAAALVGPAFAPALTFLVRPCHLLPALLPFSLPSLSCSFRR